MHDWHDIKSDAIGPGLLTWTSELSGNFSQSRTQTCHVCEGFGEVVEKGHECGRCLGDRMIVEQVPVSFWTPIGVLHGYSKRFPGMGSSTLAYPHPVDLLVHVKVHVPSRWQRDGGDLRTSMNITLEEATNGFVRNFTNFDDTIHLLTKTGVTFTGDEIMLEGEGLPLELTEEESEEYRGLLANWTECVEFWSIAEELQEEEGVQHNASSAHTDAPSANGTHVTNVTESEDGDLHDDGVSDDSSGEADDGHETLHRTEEEPKWLQECGRRPALDRGDVYISIVVSIAPPPSRQSSGGDDDGENEGEGGLGATMNSFFDSFVNDA